MPELKHARSYDVRVAGLIALNRVGPEVGILCAEYSLRTCSTNAQLVACVPAPLASNGTRMSVAMRSHATAPGGRSLTGSPMPDFGGAFVCDDGCDSTALTPK